MLAERRLLIGAENRVEQWWGRVVTYSCSRTYAADERQPDAIR
jgi:hypothetical protein